MQRLTTREPDLGMLAVAIDAMNTALHGLPKEAEAAAESDMEVCDAKPSPSVG